MGMRMVTLENGWTGVVAEKLSGTGKSGASGFAAELNRVAEAAKQAEASGDADLKAAYDRLSDSSKAVLGRLKAGEKISEDEWRAIRREMMDQGLISSYEFAYSDPQIVIVGYIDENGEIVSYSPDVARVPPGMEYAHFLLGGTGTCKIDGEVYGRFWVFEEWSGDPVGFLEKWLEAITGWRDDLDQAVRPNGQPYDTSHLTNQIEAKQKVNDLVYSLAQYC